MNILITAGGTTEKIDDVRKITNSGTGRLGATVANCFATFDEVETIYYVCSEKAIRPDTAKAQVIVADDTLGLEKAVRSLCESTSIDVVVHSMAVSDYRVRSVSTAELIAKNLSEVMLANSDSNNEATITDIVSNPPSIITQEDSTSNPDFSAERSKISSNNENLVIVMEKTPKIIALFREYLPKSIIFGFKLLVDVSDETLINVAYELLQKNACNYVVANDLRTTGQDNHIAHIVDCKKEYNTYNGKQAIAQAICEIAISDFSNHN